MITISIGSCNAGVPRQQSCSTFAATPKLLPWPMASAAVPTAGTGRALCSGDGKNRKPENVVWLIISMIIQYISMIFNDSCPVSGGYLTHTWCCHNFLGWTLEVIAMFQNRWESSGNGVKRCGTTKMWGLTTNHFAPVWSLPSFHQITEKTQEELHFTPRPLKLVLGHLDKRIRAKRS